MQYIKQIQFLLDETYLIFKFQVPSSVIVLGFFCISEVSSKFSMRYLLNYMQIFKE